MYPNDELSEVLAPAYGPCRHMFTHGGGCLESQWNPAAGHVPRGVLGATGELDEVELVMVLAEPGDPKRTENYVGSLAPADLLRRVVDFVHGTYVSRDKTVHGTVQCVVRWFLDRWFCGMNLEQQLRRVWITQARLCSRGEGSYSIPFYRPCGDAYLAAQLRLLPTVPIIAFGDKADEALRRLSFRATKVPHPSARASNESKRVQWERAIEELRSFEGPRTSTYTGATRRWAQQWPNPDRQVHPRGTIRDRSLQHERVESVATAGLPAPVAAFLVAAVEAGYEVRWGNRQNKSLLYDGRWLGGWNHKAKHWYVRTSAIGERSSLPRQHGFEPRRHGTLWLRSGKKAPKEATDAFRSVIKALTGVTVPVSD